MNILKYTLTICALSLLFLSGCEECVIVNLGDSNLPTAHIHSYYEERIDAVTHCKPTVEDYHLIGGLLPPGISLSRHGYLTGSPSRTGRFNFSVAVEVCFSEDGFNYYDCEERAQGFELIVQ